MPKDPDPTPSTPAAPAVKKTGIYVTPAGLGTAQVRVFASAPRARKLGTAVNPGEPEGPEPVYDLSRTEGGPPVVTCAVHSPVPTEGCWTSD